VGEVRSEEQLRARCVDLVCDLGILPPLDPVALCRRLSERRGRRIRLTAADLGSTTSVGHLVIQTRCDRILYERTAPRPQRDHVIYHEVMHLVLGHLADGEPLTCGSSLFSDGGDRDDGPYSGWQEWEAETGATILSGMARARPRPDRLPMSARPAEQGIAAAFGLVPGGWR
jgi:hypothetical protein